MKLTLKHKLHLQDNIWQLRFKPAESVHWLAGQFIRLEVPHASADAAGTLRWFTISGAPGETEISITTRASASSFKHALLNLEVGDDAILREQPSGNFTWVSSERQLIFIAQGIGMTPFYAIIKDRIKRRVPVHATLINAHQAVSKPVFADELTAWAEMDRTLSMINYSGTITPSVIPELVPDFVKRLIYVSGPKSFIKLCLPPYDLPIDQLKQDNFPGYSSAQY